MTRVAVVETLVTQKRRKCRLRGSSIGNAAASVQHTPAFAFAVEGVTATQADRRVGFMAMHRDSPHDGANRAQAASEWRAGERFAWIAAPPPGLSAFLAERSWTALPICCHGRYHGRPTVPATLHARAIGCSSPW